MFEFSSSDDTAAFICKLDVAAFTGCTSPRLYTNVADGAHRFEVRAVDPEGRVNPTGAISDFTIDTRAPVASFDGQPAGRINTDTITVSFSADEGGVSFACRLDGSVSTGCSSPIELSDLTD